jgi:hypothetical protein
MSKGKLIGQLAAENAVLRDRLYNRETALAAKLRAIQALSEMADRVASSGGKHAPWWASRIIALSNLFSYYDSTLGQLEDAISVNEWLSHTNQQQASKIKELEQMNDILSESF